MHSYVCLIAWLALFATQPDTQTKTLSHRLSGAPADNLAQYLKWERQINTGIAELTKMAGDTETYTFEAAEWLRSGKEYPPNSGAFYNALRRYHEATEFMRRLEAKLRAAETELKQLRTWIDAERKGERDNSPKPQKRTRNTLPGGPPAKTT